LARASESALYRLLLSFRWAGEGLIWALRTQQNLRIHALATLVACSVSLWRGLSHVEWAVLLLTCALVWGLELLNSALEAALDYLAPERHPQIKIAKDAAAAAVLVAALFALGVAGCLWWR
jgi:diacylglycerol kinase